MTIAKLLNDVKSQWAVLAAAATALVAIVGAFVTPPPFVGADVWTGYTKFVVAILFAIAAIAMARWTSRRFLMSWIAMVILLLVVGTVAYEYYQFEFNRDTREYATHRIVVGNKYTDDATLERAKLVREHSSATDEDLIALYAGEVDAIWTRESIRLDRQLLASLYSACVIIFSLLLLSAVQAVRCANLQTAPNPVKDQE